MRSITALFFIILCPIFLQAQDVIDGGFVLNHWPYNNADKRYFDNKTDIAIPYTHLREPDTVWTKRVWRVIDLNDPANALLQNPIAMGKDTMTFIEAIIEEALTHGTLMIYSGDTRMAGTGVNGPIIITGRSNREILLGIDTVYEEDIETWELIPKVVESTSYDTSLQNVYVSMDFYYPLTRGEIREVVYPAETLYVEDFETGELSEEILSIYFNYVDNTKYVIKEDWFWDYGKNQLDVRIIGLYPVVNVFDEGGEVVGEKIFFQVYYNELMEVALSSQPYYADYMEFFKKRKFASSVLGSISLYVDFHLPYATELDAYMELMLLEEDSRQNPGNYPDKMRSVLEKGKGKLQVTYDDGKTKFATSLKAGKPQGTFTMWYPNGNKMEEGEFVRGKKEGTWKHWYENGQLMSERKFINGRQHGHQLIWYDNGQKQFEFDCANGTLDGAWKRWYPTGQLMEQGQCKEGKDTGSWEYWNELGEVHENETY